MIECGDFRQYISKIDDNSIDLVVTDPPYLIQYATKYRKNKQHDFCSVISGDNDENLIHDMFVQSYRVLKENTAMYCFTSAKTLPKFINEAESAGFNVKNTIIWYKNQHTAGDLKAQFGQSYEPILLLNKGRCFINGYRYEDVWTFNRVSGKNQLHQNQKPVELLVRMIEAHSAAGGVVLDPFMGVGSTGVACALTGRQFIGYEISEKYFNIAKSRIESAQGGK